jgi:hypothetical protein
LSDVKVVTLCEFDNNIIPFGETAVPFSFEIPHDVVQSLHYYHGNYELYARVKYLLKAQVTPVDVSLLVDEYGKSQLRDSHRILLSPTRPIVQNPQFDIDLNW